MPTLPPRLALALSLPPLLWAGNAVVARIAIESISPLWLNVLRWAIALALLLPLGWRAVATPARRAQLAARWPHLALQTSTSLNVTLIAAVAYVGVLPSLVAYRLWGLGVAAAGPTVAAFFANLTPLFATLLGAAMLGQWPQPFHGLAFALIVAGIVVSARR